MTTHLGANAPAMGCENCVSRREFLAKATLAAAALAALDACGDGQIGGSTAPVTGTFTVRLADFPGLAATGTLVDVGRVAPQRAVVRTGTATFAAFSKLCTHQQCETDVRNNRFECPCHGSRFASDGSVINGPNVASAPITPLAHVSVTFNTADNTLTLS